MKIPGMTIDQYEDLVQKEAHLLRNKIVEYGVRKTLRTTKGNSTSIRKILNEDHSIGLGTIIKIKEQLRHAS